MNVVGPLIPVGLGLLVLGWVIFRSMIRRSHRNQQASPQRQVAEVKAELDKRESRGDRALRDAPPEILRWQAEIFDASREIHGQLDTKIAILSATIRLADERLAELKQAVEAAESLLPQPSDATPTNSEIGSAPVHGVPDDSSSSKPVPTRF